MKPCKWFATAFILVFGLVPAVSASLIGDEVLYEYYRNSSFVSGSSQIVESGPGDAVTLGEFTLDMEADYLDVGISSFNIFPSTALLWGLKIEGLNHQENPDWILLGVNIETSLAGWDDSRMSFYNDEEGGNLELNFQGMRLPLGESLTAMFEFGPNPIPIPATAALFITGLVGFILVRQKIRR